MTQSMPLRLNLGDPSEARVYYLPHCVAHARGYFVDEGVDVVFTGTRTGGHTALGGQIPAVIDGTADLAIGGPMVNMRMRQENTAHLVAFCAAVSANPWFLAGRAARPPVALAELGGRRVVDVANVATASLCFRWLLENASAAPVDVEVVPGSGDEAADLAAVLDGRYDYALHSLHALAPHLAAQPGLSLACDLASAMGPVPWSAYIADPRTIAARRGEFRAFTRAIRRALSDIAALPAADLAGIAGPYFPGYPLGALTFAIERYRAIGAWPETTLVTRESFERFSTVLQDRGWLAAPADYASDVATAFAEGDAP